MDWFVTLQALLLSFGISGDVNPHTVVVQESHAAPTWSMPAPPPPVEAVGARRVRREGSGISNGF